MRKFLAYSAIAVSAASGAGRAADFTSWADMVLALLALVDRHELEILGTYVVGRRPDDLAVGALLDHVRRPAGGARDYEQRREHLGRDAHGVVGDGREPVEVREHLLRLE